jgi:hypothetical protein
VLVAVDFIIVSAKNLTTKNYRYCKRSAPRSHAEDEAGPLGVGLQEQSSNHLKLLWSKAMVVSVEEKSRLRIVAEVGLRETRVSEPFDEASKCIG